MQKLSLACAVLILCPITVRAALHDYINSPVSFGLEYGVMLGGSDVLDKNISGGGDTNHIMDGGDGEYFDLRLSGYPSNGPVGVDVAVGYDQGGDQPFCLAGAVFNPGASQCLYFLRREFGDVFLRYRLNDVSVFALGRTFHRNIVLSTDDDGNPFPDVHFGNAAGWSVEYEREMADTPGVYWGIRYTHIMYHTPNTGAAVNASSIGMYIGLGTL